MCREAPIFAGDESDAPQHCDFCGRYIETSLTDEGQRYVLRALARHLRRGEGVRNILLEWAESVAGYGLRPGHRKLVQRFLDTWGGE